MTVPAIMLPTILGERQEMRQVILAIEKNIKAYNEANQLAEPELPLEHTFAPGAYARTMFIPKGVLVVGKIHKHAHLNIISQGRVSVATEDGPKHYCGPMVMTSKAGTKRVVFAHEDTVWTTIHLTEKTDLEAIEEEIIAKTFEEFDALQDRDVLQLLPIMEAKEPV